MGAAILEERENYHKWRPGKISSSIGSSSSVTLRANTSIKHNNQHINETRMSRDGRQGRGRGRRGVWQYLRESCQLAGLQLDQGAVCVKPNRPTAALFVESFAHAGAAVELRPSNHALHNHVRAYTKDRVSSSLGSHASTP